MKLIIRRLTISEWQKLYNQWNNTYELEILKIVHHDVLNVSQNKHTDECTIYLKREPKTNP